MNPASPAVTARALREGALSLGGAFAALYGPESVFHNPAGLAGVKRLTFLHNHSSRHFPGSTEGGMSVA